MILFVIDICFAPRAAEHGLNDSYRTYEI